MRGSVLTDGSRASTAGAAETACGKRPLASSAMLSEWSSVNVIRRLAGVSVHRLALAPPGCGLRQHLLAGLAHFVEMSFHASLDAAGARPDTGAILFDVSRTSLTDRRCLEHYSLTGLGEIFEVRLDAGFDPALAGLDAGALRLDVGGACFGDSLLRQGCGRAGHDGQGGDTEASASRSLLMMRSSCC